jgi:nitrous oxidase accessory protein
VDHGGHSDHGSMSSTGDLQAMLDDAAPGSVIELAPTMYHGTFSISKPVIVRGNGATLHGDGTGTVLDIRADDVVVEDLAVTRSARGPLGSPSGVDVRGRQVTLRRVAVSDTYLGIAIYGSRDVALESVRVTGRSSGALGQTDHATGSHSGETRQDMTEGRGDGIAIINSKDVLVRGSTIVYARDGIYLSFAAHVMLDRNRVTDGRYGIHSMYTRDLTVASSRLEDGVAGAVLMYGGSLMVFDNELSGNSSASTGFGLLVKDVSNVEVAKNVIEGNRVGLHVEGPPEGDSDGQRFVLNTIALNGVGAAILPSAQARFSGNSFVENNLQAQIVGGDSAPNVYWTEHGAGNYWSDYSGFDRGVDGVGDMPYRQSGVTSRLLEDNPSLHALVGSPALSFALASQERWSREGIGILDELPLMEPHSPGVAAPAPGDPKPMLVVSLALLVLAAVVLRRGMKAKPRTGRRIDLERRVAGETA